MRGVCNRTVCPGLTLEFNDQRRHRFNEPRGLQGFLEADGPDTSETLVIDGTSGDVGVELVARWHAHPWSAIESFANIERATEGGAHVRGLMAGLTRGLRAAAPMACRKRTARQLSRVITEGLNAVVCVCLKDPTYGGPTRGKLMTKAAESAVKACVADAFASFLQREKALLERFISAFAGEFWGNTPSTAPPAATPPESPPVAPPPESMSDGAASDQTQAAAGAVGGYVVIEIARQAAQRQAANQSYKPQ